MKINFKILISFLMIFAFTSSFSQKGTVLVMNSDKETEKQTIYVKWFIDKVFSKKGVNIYRKSEGATKWEKLNNNAYTFNQEIPKQEFVKDTSLQEFVTIVKETERKDIKGMLLLNILLKAIQSDVYAMHLGILFKDNSVNLGETYTYKVMQIAGNKEQLIGISQEITAGNYLPDKAPQEIEITPKRKRAEIVWKPETNRYYSINIFRSSSVDSKEVKLNKYPIMLSEKRNKDGSIIIPKPYFTDRKLKESITYFYRIEGMDFFGRKTESSEKITVRIKDSTPPPAPYNLHFEQDNLKTTLIWNIDYSDDLYGFNIYKSKDDSIYNKINTKLLAKTDTSFIDIAKKSGFYFYYVTSVDKANNEARTPKIMVEIPDIVPPVNPKNLTAKSDTGKIHLTWQANIEDDLLGYIVYRRIAKKNDEFAPLMADPIKNNQFTDKLSKIARNYFEYVVTAVDSSYNVSKHSNIASAQMPDILPPHNPKFKKTYITDDGVVVEWVPNLEPDLLGYNIYKKEKHEKEYKKLNKKLLAPNTVKYTDKNNKAKLVYYYQLNAVDSVGNTSRFSTPFFAAIVKPIVTDSSSLKKVTINYNKRKKAVHIKWKISEETEYKGCVVFKQKEGKQFKPLTGLMNKKRFTDKNIKENQTYSYQIRLYENNGKVFKSEIITINTSE